MRTLILTLLASVVAVPMTLGAVAAAEPHAGETVRTRVRGERLTVSEKGDAYHVCFRFRETGSRVWRDSCGLPPVQRVIHTNNRSLPVRDLGRHQRLREDAQTISDFLSKQRAQFPTLKAAVDAAVKKLEKDSIRRNATTPNFGGSPFGGG